MDGAARIWTPAQSLSAARVDPIEGLFLLSAFIVPLSLSIARAFTAYDLLTAVLAVLIFGSRRRLRRIPTSCLVAALFLLSAGLISAFRSTYPVEAINQVLQYAFIFFVQIPVILTVVRSRRMVERALLAFIAGYAVVVLVAMLSDRVQGAGRVVPYFNDNPNALGVPVAFLTPLILYFVRSLWRRHVLGAVAIGCTAVYLMLWALNASASRGAAIGTIVSASVFVVCADGPRIDRTTLFRLGAVALAIVSLGVLVIYSPIYPSTLRERIVGSVTTSQDPTVTDDRVTLDRAAWRAFLASPLVGTGFDNFRYVSQVYDPEATFHDPHDLWIQFLAQTGIVGAAAFAFIIGRWFLMLFRVQRSSGALGVQGLAWAFIAAFAGVLTVGLATPVIILRHYWLLFGLAMAFAADRRISFGPGSPILRSHTSSSKSPLALEGGE